MDYEKKLTRTLEFLKAPKTARQVAERFKISAFASYERLRALEARGRVVRTGKQVGPTGKTGPKASTWMWFV